MAAARHAVACVATAMRGRGAGGGLAFLCPAMRTASFRAAPRPALPHASPPSPRPAAFSQLRLASDLLLHALAPIVRGGGAVCEEKRTMSSLSVPVEAGRVFAPATVFAVAEVGGKQYKVTVDDSIVTENMVGRRVGKSTLSLLPTPLNHNPASACRSFCFVSPVLTQTKVLFVQGRQWFLTR